MLEAGGEPTRDSSVRERVTERIVRGAMNERGHTSQRGAISERRNVCVRGNGVREAGERQREWQRRADPE